MDTTVILVALIIGFTAIAVFSLTAMLIVRSREKKYEDVKDVSKAIEELDAALDAAVTEINKLGALVKSEVDEKYKLVLFLYDLVEGKQKKIEESVDGEVISEMFAKYIEAHGTKLRLMTEPPKSPEKTKKIEPDETESKPETILKVTPKPQKPLEFSNPKHKQIWQMRENGQNVPEIAKELGMGQGEVKLILDLVDRAS